MFVDLICLGEKLRKSPRFSNQPGRGNPPHNSKTMKTIKASYFGGNCQGGTMGYTIGKKDYEVTGEFYYNKSKDRIEHIHEVVRGGQYLIIW